MELRKRIFKLCPFTKDAVKYQKDVFLELNDRSDFVMVQKVPSPCRHCSHNTSKFLSTRGLDVNVN